MRKKLVFVTSVLALLIACSDGSESEDNCNLAQDVQLRVEGELLISRENSVGDEVLFKKYYTHEVENMASFFSLDCNCDDIFELRIGGKIRQIACGEKERLALSKGENSIMLCRQQLCQTYFVNRIEGTRDYRPPSNYVTSSADRVSVENSNYEAPVSASEDEWSQTDFDQEKNEETTKLDVALLRKYVVGRQYNFGNLSPVRNGDKVEWRFCDGSSYSGQVISHSFNKPGYCSIKVYTKNDYIEKDLLVVASTDTKQSSSEEGLVLDIRWPIGSVEIGQNFELTNIWIGVRARNTSWSLETGADDRPLARLIGKTVRYKYVRPGTYKIIAELGSESESHIITVIDKNQGLTRDIDSRSDSDAVDSDDSFSRSTSKEIADEWTCSSGPKSLGFPDIDTYTSTGERFDMEIQPTTKLQLKYISLKSLASQFVVLSLYDGSEKLWTGRLKLLKGYNRDLTISYEDGLTANKIYTLRVEGESELAASGVEGSYSTNDLTIKCQGSTVLGQLNYCK